MFWIWSVIGLRCGMPGCEDAAVKVLLDTCVISELRRSNGDRRVRESVEGFSSEDLFLSVLSIGEIARGIGLLAEGRKKQGLGNWMKTVMQLYGDRVLPVDLETSRLWGELTAAAGRLGKGIPVADGLIAATARRHGLQVMTRNTADFEWTGVVVINPWTVVV